MYDKSINIPKFLEFLDKLRRNTFVDDIAVFFDNLSVHRSAVVKERMDLLSIPYVFNCILSPEFNPIENVFSIVKRNFKKLRLKAMI